jgi:hypothetical protein
VAVRLRYAVLAAGLAIAVAGCGGSGVSKQSRAEAARVVRETHRFLTQTKPLRTRESNALTTDFNTCPLVKTSAYLPPESALQILWFVGTYKTVAAAYAQHAQRLRQIAATDPALRQAASFAARLAARYRPLSHAHPGYCRVFKAWQAAGWRKSFDIRPVIGVPTTLLDRAGFDQSHLESVAHELFSAATERLERLGASKRDAEEFAGALDL